MGCITARSGTQCYAMDEADMKARLSRTAAAVAVCMWLASCTNALDDSQSYAVDSPALGFQAKESPENPRRAPGALVARTSTPIPQAACDTPCATGRPHLGCDDGCTIAVTRIDPFCGNQWWDEMCVDEAALSCELDCGCTHRLTKEGPAQSARHCGCAAIVCRFDDYCCQTFWDKICVYEAIDECGL